MFGSEELNRLVECAARALQCEDAHIQECERRNKWPPGRFGFSGLRRLSGAERYYQAIIWRELISSFPLLAVMEWRATDKYIKQGCLRAPGPCDLAFVDTAGEPVALVEIKTWFGPSGKSELKAIEYDMANKLENLAIPSAELVLTCHGSDNAEDNFQFFACEMQIPRSSLVIKSFLTSPGCEFAVFGFMVKAQGEAHMASA